ncbi:MAG: hypothetical protein A2Y79_01455 [Deltaproteobacteria bacterium RBG_13_43_22]|nr:MAG: hypothetical protein A2Y79_01455 [Deltaproteobacteria bacterium RBG_13_43_22]
MRNESTFILKCLESLKLQDYPYDCYEVMIVDGSSTDGSKELLESFDFGKINLHLMENPLKITPVALNIGVKAAKGDVIIILGAHTQVSSNFIKENIASLQRTGADCVGGLIQTVGDSFIGKAIALALSNPFGIGNAKFRYSTREEYVDTVAFPAFRREVFDKIGYFDESLARNQDIEFSGRLRRNGGRILLSPSIKVTYYSPSSLMGLIRQSFANGWWNIYTFIKSPGSLMVRHFVPMLFVTGLIFSVLITPFNAMGLLFLILILLPYLMFNLLMSIKISINHGSLFFSVMPFVFFSLHVSYGIGSVVGMGRLFLSYIYKALIQVFINFKK